MDVCLHIIAFVLVTCTFVIGCTGRVYPEKPQSNSLRDSMQEDMESDQRELAKEIGKFSETLSEVEIGPFMFDDKTISFIINTIRSAALTELERRGECGISLSVTLRKDWRTETYSFSIPRLSIHDAFKFLAFQTDRECG